MSLAEYYENSSHWPLPNEFGRRVDLLCISAGLVVCPSSKGLGRNSWKQIAMEIADCGLRIAESLVAVDMSTLPYPIPQARTPNN